MTPETDKLYGKFTEVVARHAPNLTVLVMTKEDLKTAAPPDIRTHLLQRSSCDADTFPRTAETELSEQALEEAEKQVLVLIESFSADPQNSVISRKNLQATLKANESLFKAHLSGAAIQALTDAASSYYLTKDFPTIQNKFAIITVPAKLPTPIEKGAQYSGVSAKYLDTPDGTPEDWAIFTLGHEIAGHAANEHDINISRKDYCKSVDIAWTDARVVHENEADGAGRNVYWYAQTKGVASPANVPEQATALRSLGNLYINPNTLTVKNTSQLHQHSTYGDFNSFHTPPLTRPALLVNMVADTITGFVHSQQVKEDILLNPQNYSEQQITEYERIPSNPRYIENNLKAFASLGQKVRKEKPTDPQWHYAAISYIKDNNALAGIKQNLTAEEKTLVDKFVDDFLAAADVRAPKLKNPEISQKIMEWLPPQQGTLSFFARYNIDGKAVNTATDMPSGLPTPQS